MCSLRVPPATIRLQIPLELLFKNTVKVCPLLFIAGPPCHFQIEISLL